MKVYFQKIYPEATLPTRGSQYAAGWDLSAAHSGIIGPGQRMVVKTGLRMAIEVEDGDGIPEGILPVAKVCSRSGLAAKQGVFVLNSPGIIDYDYRGELMVILHNAGEKAFAFTQGDRVAQLLFEYVAIPDSIEVEEVPVDTERGEGGLGSTGVGNVKAAA